MMWSMPILSTKFYLIVIASLVLALTLSQLHGQILKAEKDTAIAQRDAKTAVIESMTKAAQNYEAESIIKAKVKSDEFNKLVEQIRTKDIAINAAKARFGTCNVARGITTRGVLNVPSNTGEANVPESSDELRTEERVAIDREHIDDYAACIGFVKATKTWALIHNLPISKE